MAASSSYPCRSSRCCERQGVSSHYPVPVCRGSQDYWQCLRCGWEKHGLGGCYHKPNCDEWEAYKKDYTDPLAEEE